MPKTQTKNPHPIIKILSDLNLLPEKGEDVDAKSYKRAVRTAIVTIESSSKDKAGDSRSRMLRDELKRIKELEREKKEVEPPTSEVGVKEKKTTIKAAKLLPGTATTKPDDLKQAQIDESGEDKSKLLQPDILNDIAKSVESIATLLKRQLGVEKKQQRDAKIKQDKDNKSAREDKLETKPDKKTGGLPKAIAKPVIGFFDRIKKFFFNIGIGAALYKMHAWMTDPANTEKIGKFTDFLIKHAPLILGGLAALALLPVVGGLVGMIGGIMGGLSMLGLAVPLLPIILKGMLIAAVIALTIAAGKKVVRGVENIFTGGEAFTQGHNKAKSKLEAAGLQDLGRAWRGGGTPIRVKVSDNHHGTGKPSWKTVKYEDLNPTQKKAWDEYMVEKNRIIGLKEQMHTELRDKVHVGGSIENERDSYSNEEFLAISKIEDMDERKKKLKEFRKETARLQKEERIKIEQTYSKEALNIQKNSSSATIDKDVKTNTEVPGPSTKNKAGNLVLAGGGGGNQQQVSSGGSSGGSSSTPKFSSEDSNNLSTLATSTTYNMVGV